LESVSPIPLKKSKIQGASFNTQASSSQLAQEVTRELTRRIIEDFSLKQPSSKRADLLSTTPIHAVIPAQDLLFVKETHTAAEVIQVLAQNKANFVIVLGERDQPGRTVDILDIVAHCNKTISKNASKSNLFEIANHLETLKYQLAKSTLKEILPLPNWYGRTMSATKSMRQLITVMSKFPTLKRVIVTNKKKVVAVVTRDDVLTFLLSNEENFAEKMMQPLSQTNMQKCSVPSDAPLEEMLGCAFQAMWDKQIVGKLASCYGSSPLDLFFNWLHYVHSASSLLNLEPAHIREDATVREALEQFLRENIDELFIMDPKSKKTIGLLTISDLIEIFC